MNSNTIKNKSKLKKSRKYHISLLFSSRRQKVHRTLRQTEDLLNDNSRVILHFVIGPVED